MKEHTKRILVLVCLAVLMSTAFVFAADAEATWTGIWDLITKWIIRIGAAIALFGGISIGISFASDNPDARIRGLQFLAAGLIVMAVGAAPGIFGVV